MVVQPGDMGDRLYLRHGRHSWPSHGLAWSGVSVPCVNFCVWCRPTLTRLRHWPATTGKRASGQRRHVLPLARTERRTPG